MAEESSTIHSKLVREDVFSQSHPNGQKAIELRRSDVEAPRQSDVEAGGAAAGAGGEPSCPERPSDLTVRFTKAERLKSLAKRDFYKQDDWVDQLCEILFKIKERQTTVKAELYYGVIHFISCVYCLAVIPQQLKNAGYDTKRTIVAVALCSGAGSILAGLFANLPFVLAPPTVVSIFLSVYLQQKSEGPHEGSVAVILSGILLLFFGWRPIGKLAANLIPQSIQVGTAVGIGLLTALSGSTEIDLVEPGNYVILRIGKITAEICIVFAGIIFICVAMRFHWKGSFCMAVISCSLVWWIYQSDFPKSIVAAPQIDTFKRQHSNGSNVTFLTADLIFLYVLYLNGLMTSLSNLAVLTRTDSTIPRGRWIYIICGILTVVSGLFSSAPILVSPESSASIKEGAKTGLSAVVAGILFLVSLFFSPIFEKVPAAGTSPVLIMIGVILFQNVSRIDWRNVTYAAPAFVVLFYIPFTYSIIQGVIMGYIVYLTVSLATGELGDNAMLFIREVFPHLENQLVKFLKLEERQSALSKQHSDKLSDAYSAGVLAQQHASFGLGTDMVTKSWKNKSFSSPDDDEDDEAPVFH